MTESRNKREGQYCGRTRYCGKTGGRTRASKHYRKGSEFWHMGLRDWEKQRKGAAWLN